MREGQDGVAEGRGPWRSRDSNFCPGHQKTGDEAPLWPKFCEPGSGSTAAEIMAISLQSFVKLA